MQHQPDDENQAATTQNSAEQRVSTDPVRQRKGTFLASMKAVFWSFFGVRKGLHSTEDEAQLNPVYVVFAALLAAFIFIVALIVIVKIVLARIVI